MEVKKTKWGKLTHWGKTIFVPDQLTLDDGITVVPPKPILPYILLGFIVVFYFAAQITDFSLITIISRLFNFRFGPVAYLKRMFPVDWAYWPNVISPMVETIQMSLLGSFIGAAISLPVAFLASNNMVKNKVVIAVIRILLSITRTLPILIYGLFFKLIYGPGALAGTIAIALFTFSIVSKMLYEKIETIDLGAFEALQSTGASKSKSFVTAVIPEILPSYLSLSLYAFEINIRYAAILGYVGAGGIGFSLDNALKNIRDNDRIIVIVLFIFFVVVLIETLSRYLRRRLG